MVKNPTIVHITYVFFFSYFPLLIDFDRFWMILVVFNGFAPNARKMLNLPKEKHTEQCESKSGFSIFVHGLWMIGDYLGGDGFEHH